MRRKVPDAGRLPISYCARSNGQGRARNVPLMFGVGQTRVGEGCGSFRVTVLTSTTRTGNTIHARDIDRGKAFSLRAGTITE